MLFLQPPTHLINGVAVFGDHASTRQFWYLPAMPHLSTAPHPATGEPVPKLQLLKFRGDAGNGGFLTFEVDLGFEETVLDDIKAELRRLHRLTEEPILSAAPVEAGTVELIMLGAAEDAQGKPLVDEEGQQRFVVRKSHPRSPALYGRNNAIFSVELDEEGVGLVEGSLVDSELLPIGVVYKLDFYALRPAFSVKVTADWERVQNHLEESFSAEVLFSSVEIDKVVDKLIEDQVVKIEVDTFLPEGEDPGSWIGRRDNAVNEFKDMVLENFFKPSLEPVREEKDGWDRFSDTAERLSTLAVTGGWSGIAQFSYVKKEITRIDQKRANLQMNERVTVRRSIYPQATLKGLGRVLRDASGQLDPSFIKTVTLDDPWFDKRTVQAHSLVNFDHDDVASVNLTLSYDGEPRTIRMSKEATSGIAEWNSTVTDGRMAREVRYDYRVTFDGVDSGQRPAVLLSSGRATIGDEFEVSPRADGVYYLDDIQIGASLLPWDRYPQVAVEVRYADPAQHIRLAETFLLSRNASEATWTRFRLDPALTGYDVRVTFLSATGHDVLQDWTRTDQERLVIRDPHPLRRTVTIAPAVDWRLVAMVFVELRYLDRANGVDEQATLSFFDTPEDRAPKTYTVNLVDGEQRLVMWNATYVLVDNRTITVPPSMTAGSTVVLRTDMAGHRVITVTSPPVDFAARGITRMEVTLDFVDDESGLSYSDQYTFTGPGQSGYFEYDYTSTQRSSYSGRVRTVYDNGLAQDRGLGPSDADRLELSA